MKRFQAMAQRITAFVLSAGMMASAAAPTVLAAQQVPSAPLGAETAWTSWATRIFRTRPIMNRTTGAWQPMPLTIRGVSGTMVHIKRARMARFRMSRFVSVLIAASFNWRTVLF